jgi:restriction endonuclease Mrr
MQERVMEQVEALEVFFSTTNEGKSLNVTQEVLFALIAMLDLRDDATVTSENLGRLSLIIGQKLNGSEEFTQEYFVKTSTFVALYLQSISEVMLSAQEWEMQNMMQECSAFLASKLPTRGERRVMEVSLKALVSKIERLAQEVSFQDESIVEEMQKQLNSENIEQLSMLDPSQSISIILGSVVGVLSVMSQKEI